MDPQLAVNNIFSSNIAAFLLPNGYAEIGHSTGGSLLSIDNNLVRNCWHLFVIDGLAILLWFVTSIIHQKAN